MKEIESAKYVPPPNNDGEIARRRFFALAFACLGLARYRPPELSINAKLAWADLLQENYAGRQYYTAEQLTALTRWSPDQIRRARHVVPMIQAALREL
jgi:hypothetical protein